MKKSYLILSVLFLLLTTASYSQGVIRTKKSDSIPRWTSKNTVGFDLKEIAFVNWSAGGVNAISGLVKGDFMRQYKHENMKFHNELIVRYGLNKQDGVETRKTEDVFQFNSTLSYRTDSISNWSHTTKFSFWTQFTNGYAYPNTELAISKPFAPAYTFLGIGFEYNNKEEKLNLYMSPFTFKNTLVLDQRLADQGAFGVKGAVRDANGNIIDHGKKRKTELGILLTGRYKSEIMKNIMMENQLALYTDYLNKFGNIDIDWRLQVDFVVNEYVKVNVGTHVIYDDDIKTKKQEEGVQVIVGPRIQLKQMLGIGLVYDF